MHRREFIQVAGVGIAGGRLSEAPAQTAPARGKKTLMKVGTQHGDSDDILRVLSGFGVNHICSRLPSERFDEQWSVEGLSKLRERIESFGITLDMVPLP